jgi:8-oxo-dGTP diphosphatase
MTQRTDLIVLAIIRRNAEILMVRQPAGAETLVWVLPGGLVEPGELVHEALVREVREETGLEVDAIARLAYVTQIDRPQHAMQTTAFVFEVAGWHGELGHNDPDNEIVEVAFVPLAEAIARLQSPLLWRGLSESAAAYLSAAAGPGTVWLYREHGDAQDQRLVQAIGPAT